mmetsp:Transcript_29434/g.56527  ORF Transcript_29434/g.56527 Transcript_29434/m.56527 type:complete len:589 (+) Transcript_29434:140-1906(+)|eukprot:CAMPEP_0114251970 /NCGR_PEP_ID=MMETSP0058-20121206/15571_1 /TAXON_ID=36894 /ORGANISM="Pyramimonas parkeae, CCMP726" /LENGTH=588 /DNA_ID=CAMNT_0001365841 /DNA_START=99 /DNA_END=1865 /DNA_ORIENTATION=+
MAEPDSWEDLNEEVPQAPVEPSPAEVPKPSSFAFNPSASSFSFNPSAASFNFTPPMPPAAVTPPVASSPTPPPSAPAADSPPPPVAEEYKPEPPSQDKPKQAPAPKAPKEDKDDAEAIEPELKGMTLKERKKIQEIMAEENDKREHLNIVFIGHVDAGKSTIGGQILYLTGSVDERTIQKYEREAKDKNRESWYMAYIMDTNEEERAKGKTVECGKACFETEKKRYTILDAPGHKLFVPNMINGAAQADVGVLVIAARKGEFETGFEKGGQTREHAQLAKTLGVTKLVIVVNKMDDPSVLWSQERFDEVVTKLTPFLKQCGYNTKRDCVFLPVSGLMGYGIKDKVSKEMCPWYDEGPSLFDILDGMEPQDRNENSPFRMPILDKHKDMGTMILGKTEAGTIMRGDDMMLMPNKVPIKVQAIYREETEVPYALPGENIRIRVTGVDEESVSTGFVVCAADNPGRAVKVFEAQLAVLELLEHKALFTAGYKAVMHCHTMTEEVEVIKILGTVDPKTKEISKGKKVTFVKAGAIVMVRIACVQSVLIEKFSDYPQLGRFTLRDEGKTIAIGKVTDLPKKKDPATRAPAVVA